MERTDICFRNSNLPWISVLLFTLHLASSGNKILYTPWIWNNLLIVIGTVPNICYILWEIPFIFRKITDHLQRDNICVLWHFLAFNSCFAVTYSAASWSLEQSVLSRKLREGLLGGTITNHTWWDSQCVHVLSAAGGLITFLT